SFQRRPPSPQVRSPPDRGKSITPHSLRHTFVTMALDSGQADRDIAISTGHSDTRMVAYYDRGRDNISRNSTHAVAAWIEGAV
ncbi:MAG: site-specific integrase, partial [Acidimicrobiales bacterium]